MSFLIYNSFSRRPDQPNRFHVVVLFSEPCQSIAAHQGTFDDIVRRLKEAGFPPEMSGLDRNCRSGVHSFWMPATDREHPDWAFFRTHNTKTRELRRHAINPNDYVAQAQPERVWEPAVPRETKATTGEIEAIMAPVRHLTSGREKPWTKAGVRLHNSLGLTIPEIAAEFIPWCQDGQARKKLASVIRLLRKIERRRTMNLAEQLQSDELDAQAS